MRNQGLRELGVVISLRAGTRGRYHRNSPASALPSAARVNPGEHLRIMWDRRWFVLAASIFVTAAVFAWSSNQPKTYEAATVVDVLSDASGRELPTEREQIQIATGRIAALTETSGILREGIRRAGLDITLETARERVSVGAWRDVGFVTIRATGPSPGAAEALARGTVRALVGGTESGMVLSPARVAPDPIAPRPIRDATLAFFVTLLVTVAGAALVGTSRRRLPASRVRAEVERLTTAPVLARIPRRGRDDVVEAVRELRAQVEFARAEHDIRSVVLTATDPGAGASFVTRGLAQISANLKASVALIDATYGDHPSRPSSISPRHPASATSCSVLLSTRACSLRRTHSRSGSAF